MIQYNRLFLHLTKNNINCTIPTSLWEGPTAFLLLPGDSVSHIYISHVCGDNYSDVMLLFRLQLINRTGEAWGVFSATCLHGGYANPSECRTGQLYVSNITEWKYSQSSSSSSVTESSTTSNSSTTTPSISISGNLTVGWVYSSLLLAIIAVFVHRIHKRIVLNC